MAITQADLDALNAAILGSELEVEFEGRRVRYRSVVEQMAAYEHAKRLMAEQAAPAARITYQYRLTTARGD